MNAAAFGPHLEVSFSAAVLAGGKGRRIGMKKGLLEMGGRMIVDHILDKLQEVFPLIALVVQEGDYTLDNVVRPGVEVISDAFFSNGPLVGIYTALQSSPASHVFVMACDMPYPNMDLVRYMLDQAAGREVVVPKMSDHVEPLFAVYSKDLIAKIHTFLEQDRLKIPDLFRELDVRYLEEEEVAFSDPEFRSFFNINTIDDLRYAQVSWGLLQGDRFNTTAARTGG